MLFVSSTRIIFLPAVSGKIPPGLGGLTTTAAAAAAAEQTAPVFFGHVVKLPCDQQQHKQLEPDRTDERPPKPRSDAVRVHHPSYELNVGGRFGNHGIHFHLRHADGAVGIDAAQDPTCIGVYAGHRGGGQALHRQLIRALGNVRVLENGKHAQLPAPQRYFIDTTKIIVAPNGGQRGDHQRVHHHRRHHRDQRGHPIVHAGFWMFLATAYHIFTVVVAIPQPQPLQPHWQIDPHSPEHERHCFDNLVAARGPRATSTTNHKPQP